MKKGNEKEKEKEKGRKTIPSGSDKGKIPKGKSGTGPVAGAGKGKGNAGGAGGVKAMNTNEKNDLKKEIEEMKLPLNDNIYTKDIIDIDIKFEGDLLPPIKRKASFSQLSQSKQTHSISQSQSKQVEGESIKKTITKLEKLYLECLTTTEKVKLSTTSSSEDLLKQEVLYLKTKNEILKLKADFFETIFYSVKNLIDASSSAQLQSSPIDLKEKLIGIFTQNNQHYYESFNFLQKKQFNIFSIEKSEEDNESLIDVKCLETIKSIEDCLQSIMKNVTSLTTMMTNNNKEDEASTIIFKLKDELITCNKKLLSFYALSGNYTYDFEKRRTLWLNNSEEYVKHDMLKRSKSLIDNFIQVSNPFINKVLSKKQRDSMTKSFMNTISFYENFNQMLLAENSNLKSFTNATMINLSNKTKALSALINDYNTSIETPLIKFNEVIDFIYNNQAKNMEKVLYSLMNTDKEILKSIIVEHSNFVNKYHLLK